MTYSCSKIPSDIVNTVVELLISKGADVDKPNMNGMYIFTPLMLAARDGCKNLVEIFLKHGAQRDIVEVTSGKTAADFARENGHDDIVDVIERYENQ